MELAEKNSKCQEHYLQYERERKPFSFIISHNESLPPNWARIRKQVLARDGNVCYICGGVGADSVDHVIPRWKGGSNDMRNLKAAHWNVAPYCHRTKSSREGAEASLLAAKEKKEALRKNKTTPSPSGSKRDSDVGGLGIKILPPFIAGGIIRSAQGKCFICGEFGADSAINITQKRPPSPLWMVAVHRKVGSSCLKSLNQSIIDSYVQSVENNL